MCKFNSKMGFTLIELMVVIVIIGVLASLAIPRFTEASDKAKVAEAPRILASYESAQLAHLAETNKYGGEADIIFNITAVNSDSRWFGYSAATAGNGTAAYGTATPKGGGIGKFGNYVLWTNLDSEGGIKHNASSDATAKKYVPNFAK